MSRSSINVTQWSACWKSKGIRMCCRYIMRSKYPRFIGSRVETQQVTPVKSSWQIYLVDELSSQFVSRISLYHVFLKEKNRNKKTNWIWLSFYKATWRFIPLIQLRIFYFINPDGPNSDRSLFNHSFFKLSVFTHICLDRWSQRSQKQRKLIW